MIVLAGVLDRAADAALRGLARALHRARCASSCRGWAGSARRRPMRARMMTGRITDAYTNIATVKLFSHTQPRGRLRARGDAGVHAHRLRPDAAGERLRDRQPRAQHGPDRRHGGHGAVAVVAGRGRRRRGGGGHRDGAAAAGHVALDHVGDDQPVREHRHRAGRHRTRCRARAPWSTRPMPRTLRGAARRGALRARQLPLRPTARRAA